METCLSVLLMSAAHASVKCKVGNGAWGPAVAAAGARWRMAVHNLSFKGQEISAPFIIRAVDLIAGCHHIFSSTEMFTVLLGRMRLIEQHHVTTRPLKT